ncbi:MAG: hypothetical protein ACKV2V_05170 [Blastocatellia bacterium]
MIKQTQLKKPALVFFASGMTLALAGVAVWFNLNAQLLSGILGKMEKANQELKSLRAVITQERVSVRIGVPDRSEGYGFRRHHLQAGRAGEGEAAHRLSETRRQCAVGDW